MSVFMPILYYFDYCSFAVSFENRKYDSSSFVLPFQDFLATWSPLRFYLNFRMGFSIFAKNKKRHWDSDRDCIKSVDCME